MSNLKFSIITTTYNSSNTVNDCVNSVLYQTYKNREHIIIDAESTDGTVEYCKKNINLFSVFVSRPDDGIYYGLNEGIGYASGDVIGFLHSDDMYFNDDVLEKIAEAFERDSSICAVYGDLIYVSKLDSNKIIRHWKSRSFNKRMLRLGWMPPHPTLYVRKEWYAKICSFDTKFKISSDYLSVLELFGDTNFKAKYLPITFVKMRIGGISNRNIKLILMKSKEDYSAMRKCGFSVLSAIFVLVLKNSSKLGQFFKIGYKNP